MRCRIFFFSLALFPAALTGEEPLTVAPREIPRFPPLEPEQALAAFKVKPGFRVELVASEPLVVDPIAVCFDENGRMFALEMRDYSERRDVKPHLGRVRLLEDTKGSGRCDKATIFADDLPWPTGLFWASGGLFVCAAPDILWFKDTDGDGRADLREVLYTGFNTGSPKLNVQALPNSFAWGPDNRIHLQSGGGNRGVIRCVKRPDLPAHELAGRDFWFDPRTLEFGFEAGGGQYGMSYDNTGRRFVCNNSDHLRVYLFDDRYAARNPFFTLPSPLVSVAADGGAAEVFRISPDEPWRVVRTRWRVAGKVGGPVEGGGRVSGYFTGATGTTVYRGHAFGPDFVGNTFTGDAGGNLVHRKRLRPDGVSVLGERPEDERDHEFLASRDTWFRPVSFANAPDGTLYVIDMYREVIEHPWSIPEPIKQHLDLNSGQDRGRIWRIAPGGFREPGSPRLDAATNKELIAMLAHPNGWHRDTATRLLCERRDKSVVRDLETTAANSRAPLGRLHALRALDGLEALSEDLVLDALGDHDDAVRELALKLGEKLRRDGELPHPLWLKLKSMTADASPRVRLQLAFTIGECANAGRATILAELARANLADRWITAAVLSSPPSTSVELFAELAANSEFARESRSEAFLAQLAAIVGARNESTEVAAVFAQAAAEPPRFSVIAALGEGLSRNGASLLVNERADRMNALFATAREVIANASALPVGRAAAARLLAFDDGEASRRVLLAAFRSAREPLTAAILEAAGRWPGDTFAALLDGWSEHDAGARAELVRFFAASPERAMALLRAVEQGQIARDQISPADLRAIREHRDERVAALARALFPKPPSETRDQVIHRFNPALSLRGNAKKGRPLFSQRCATCHRFRGEGHSFGPDMESVASGGKEKLLTHLIDPDREVAPQFAAYLIELQGGLTLSGILTAESSSQLVIREPLGKESALPRDKVLRFQTTGRSPMPEGLEAGLQTQDLADLLEYLTAASAK